MKTFWGFYQNLGSIEHPFGLFDLGHLAYLVVTVLIICLCFRRYKKCGAEGKRRWQRAFAVYFIVQELFFYTWTGFSCRENVFFEVLQLELCTFCLFLNFSTLFHNNKQVRFFGALVGLIGGPIAMIYPATMAGIYPVFCYRLINFYMTHGSYIFFSLMLLDDRELMDKKRLPGQLAIAAGLLAAVYCFNLKFHTQYMFVGTPPEIGFIRAIYDVVGDLLFLPTAIVVFSAAQVLMYFVVLKLQKFAYREQYIDEKILFVCLGNICRSPMAEFVMKDLVRQAGLEGEFHIESAATSAEELGNPVYPPARRKLAEHSIGCTGKTARQMNAADYQRFDLLIGMDSSNLRNMRRICGGDPDGKMRMLMDYTDRPGEVADPWYTGNFEATWQDVLDGCRGLLAQLN